MIAPGEGPYAEIRLLDPGHQATASYEIVPGVPTRLTGVEDILKGQRPSDALVKRAAAAAAAVPAEGDDANPPEYRQELAGHLTQRALTKAVRRAQT